MKLKVIKARYNPNDHWLDMSTIEVKNPIICVDIISNITTSYPEREEKLRIRKERIDKILNR